MVSQIVFTLDSKIKAKAMKRAKSVGIPFAAYLRQAAEDFAEGKVGMAIVRAEIPNAKTAKELRAAREDFKMGVNISPAFSSGAEMDKWLE